MKDYKKSLLVLLMLAMVMSGLFALSSDSINTAQAEQSKEYAVLQFGDRGDGVLQLKQRLVELGYMTEDNAGFSGSATNAADFYGPVTKSAVEQFQQVVGLPVTGIADEKTQEVLFTLSINAPNSVQGTTSNSAGYETLQKGDKGDQVKELQRRLIELNYLDGNADGDYGNKTMGAVERFQVAVGLPNSGIADNETQQRLYANDAPKAKVYKKLEYKALSRDPDAYVNEYYSFSGTIIQVLEEEQSDGSTFVTMRIATKSWYDDIVMVFYVRSKGESRFLEDDKVTVYGQYQGIYTYEAVMGNTVSVPLFEAEQVSLK